LNLESIFKSYNPINQFCSSVLMDCVKQSRKIVREERNQDTTVYTGSIQDESTFSLLLSKPTQEDSTNSMEIQELQEHLYNSRP